MLWERDCWQPTRQELLMLACDSNDDVQSIADETREQSLTDNNNSQLGAFSTPSLWADEIQHADRPAGVYIGQQWARLIAGQRVMYLQRSASNWWMQRHTHTYPALSIVYVQQLARRWDRWDDTQVTDVCTGCCCCCCCCSVQPYIPATGRLAWPTRFQQRWLTDVTLRHHWFSVQIT